MGDATRAAQRGRAARGLGGGTVAQWLDDGPVISMMQSLQRCPIDGSLWLNRAINACCHGCCMTKLTRLKDLAELLKGQSVTKVSAEAANRLTLQFANGVALIVKWRPEGLQVDLSDSGLEVEADASQRPTKRQLDYLLFIRKYIIRYGRAPAESDIERYFMVSAPSVNQMMQMLERRGFITRQAGVPRSARICIDLDRLS